MPKIVDENGFWLVKNNPITKEGVFPYLGKTISPELEPDKVYQVYRSFDELSNPETLESFNGVPFIENHEMLGENFTKVDDRPAQGVLMNPHVLRDGVIGGDLKIFSEDLKEKIESGKKELSLGYLCDYEIRSGEWNGKKYDVVQTNLRGNHIALVDKGRMGADVRIYDHCLACDGIEIENSFEKEETKKEIEKMPDKEKEVEIGKDEKVDKRELIDKVGGILKDKVSEEILRTVLGLMEKASYNESEAGKADDACGKDEEKVEEKKEEKEEVKEEVKDTFFDEPTTKKILNEFVASKKLDEGLKEEILKALAEATYTRAKDEEKEVEVEIEKKDEKEEEKKSGMDSAAMDALVDKIVERLSASKKSEETFAFDEKIKQPKISDVNERLAAYKANGK